MIGERKYPMTKSMPMVLDREALHEIMNGHVLHIRDTQIRANPPQREVTDTHRDHHVCL